MSEFQSQYEDIGSATGVLWLQGYADAANHDALKAQFATVAGCPSRNVIIDIKDLAFLTSLALGEMIALAKAKREVKGKVVIAGPNQYVASVFAASAIKGVIPVFPTVDLAKAAL